jgi:hypothetical protein
VRWCRCTAGRAGAPFAPRSGLTNVWSFGLADPTCTRFRKLSTLGGSICWWIAFPVVQGVPRIGCVVMRTAAGVRFRVSRAPCTAAAPPTVSRETVGGAPDRVLYRSAAHRFGTGPLPSPAGRPGLAPRTRRGRDRRRAVQSSRSASRGPGIDGDACRRRPRETLPSPAAATAVPIGRARWEPSSDPILCPGLVRMGVPSVPSGGSECVRPQGQVHTTRGGRALVGLGRKAGTGNSAPFRGREGAAPRGDVAAWIEFARRRARSRHGGVRATAHRMRRRSRGDLDWSGSRETSRSNPRVGWCGRRAPIADPGLMW